MNTLHVQVINLDRSKERWTHISDQLSRQGVAFNRLVATDGRSLSRLDLRYYDPLASVVYYGRRLSPGEIGCFRSHQRAAKAFLDSGAEFGLVLEDDAEIPADLATGLEQLTSQLRVKAPGEWELVNLGNAPKHAGHYKPIAPVTAAIDLVRTRVFPKRTTSLLWSRRGARRFLAETSRIRAPVDQHLHSALSDRETGLATIPAFIPHAPLPSDINAEPDALSIRQVDGPSVWYRFRRVMRKRAARKGKG